jgi:hypothetical protein
MGLTRVFADSSTPRSPDASIVRPVVVGDLPKPLVALSTSILGCWEEEDGREKTSVTYS